MKNLKKDSDSKTAHTPTPWENCEDCRAISSGQYRRHYCEAHDPQAEMYVDGKVVKSNSQHAPGATKYCNAGQCVEHYGTNTPLPWTVGALIESTNEINIEKDYPNGSTKLIATVCFSGGGRAEQNANAAFIVRAVDAHEELVEAIKGTLASEYVTQDGQRIPMVAGETRAILERALTKAVEK